MSVRITDTFGPLLFNSIQNLQKNLEQASQKGARYVQAEWVRGIRTQSLAKNPIQNWRPLTEKYLKSKLKRNNSNLINVLKGTYTNTIDVARNNMGYYEVGTNANNKGFSYPLLHETRGSKTYRPSLTPILILSKEFILENFKEAIQKTFT